MIVPYLSIQDFLRRFLSLCVVYAMLLPTVVHALVLVTETEHTYELMLTDHQEESENKEQQEDESKDEKIELQLLNFLEPIYHYASEDVRSKPSDAASDYILEIPFPPPERL